MVGACGDETGTGASNTVPLAERSKNQKGAKDELYDAEGNLLASGKKVAGLTLPRGLEPSTKRARSRSYTTKVPLNKVLRFFGPRLQTGTVDRIGQGIIYRQAIPRGVKGGVVKLDVSVLPSSKGGARVEIVELPPPPKTTPNRGQLAKEMDRALKRLD